MTAPVNIKDSATGMVAKVTRFGQLVVAPIQYSKPASDSLVVINTAFNFITPEAGKSIVITDILVSADNNVSNVVPADIEIYEADAVDELTANPSIINPQVVRSTNLAMTGLNLLVEEGKWVNAKTNDNNITVTIMFYRVPAENV